MLVGISGPSCSGKTTLARSIARLMNAPTLHLDRHFIEQAHRPVVNGFPSFEQPHQYDGMALLDETVAALEEHEHVVVEGFLLFVFPGFTTICDQMIHLDVPYETLAQRRFARSQENAANSDVKGGRIKLADEAWLAHGQIEWQRYGEMQAHIPGVQTFEIGKNSPMCPDEFASSLVHRWIGRSAKAA